MKKNVEFKREKIADFLILLSLRYNFSWDVISNDNIDEITIYADKVKWEDFPEIRKQLVEIFKSYKIKILNYETHELDDNILYYMVAI